MDECACPIRPNMTKQELIEEIYKPQKYCTYPFFICKNLDNELRRADKDAQSRRWREKRMKEQGYTPEQIKASKGRKRTRVAKTVEIDLSEI